MTTHLLIIDAQNSFCDPSGELYVPGAEKDMKRLADFISDNENRLDRITATQDSHNKIHIAHPIWWTDKNGNHPKPFTRISYGDVESGAWRAANPDYQEWSETYLKKIDAHVIWPFHCLIGTQGHEIFSDLLEVLNRWREHRHELDFVLKGQTRFTEHFSAVKAAMEVPGNPYTLLNTALIRSLDQADEIWVAGEATSHCVNDTVTDIVEYSDNPEIAKKIVLLSDAMSPVGGFEDMAEGFFHRMRSAGARILTIQEAAG